MNVLLVTESYWPNADGGALFERRLVLGMAARGHHMSVWAPAPRYTSYDEPDGPYTIHRQRAVTFVFNRKYKVSLAPFWDARRIILRDKPDVIHIHNTYWMGLSALFWAKRFGIPVVATNHFMPENAILNLKGVNWLYRPLEILIWKFLVWFHNRAEYVTSPTPTAVQLLLDHGLHRPVEAITNGIDTAVFQSGLDTKQVVKKLGLATDRPIILYVGRLDGEKRLDVLLEALPIVLKDQPAQLVLAGFGKAMDSLKAQTKHLGIENDVLFTGFVDEEDKPSLYNTATVFAITSPAELQSIVTLEAMASALPIVAVDVAALHELCHDGANGYLFTHENSAELAQKLIAILSDANLAGRFGQESYKIIHAHHSTEVMYNSYESAYQKTKAS
jgi:glycosyltransferase involved in cell wall biosynthesis